MADLGKAYVQIVASAEGISGSVQSVLDPEVNRAGDSAAKTLGNKMTAIGKGMQKTGMVMSMSVTAPLTALGVKGVKSFADVDKTMQLTNKTMGSSAEQAELLMKAMKDAASNSTFGMTDAANASLNFARAGLNAEQAAAALAPAMNLAAGEGGNLDVVSGGLVATINGFGGSFDDASKYADVFANACNSSALDVDSLSGSMSVAAPIFAAAGYNVNDAALYMGVLANAGIDANTGANALKTGLARLVSPAKEGSEWMEKLGLSITNSDGTMKDSVTVQKELHDAFSGLSESEQIAAASAIFGKNQMSNWLALINTAPEDVQSLSDAIGVEGTTAEMAEAMMSGFGGSLESLKSSIDVATTSLGEALAPIISDIAEKVSDAVTWFNSLDSSQQQMIAKIGLIVAAAGPLLLVGGKLVGSITTIAGGIGGLIGKFGGIGSAANSAATPVATAAGSFGTFAGQALKMVAAAAALYIAAQAISVLVDAAIRISGEGSVAIGVLAGMAVGIGALMGVAALAGPAMTAGALGIVAFGAAMLGIGEGVNLACTGIAKVTEAVGGLVETVSSNSDSINSIVTNVGDTVNGTITTISDGITSIIEAISGGVSGVLDSFSGVIDSIGNAALNAGTGFEKLAGAVINLTNNTGVFDLAGTLAAVAGGVDKINSAAAGAGDSAGQISRMTSSMTALSSATNTATSMMQRFGTTGRSAAQTVNSAFASINLSSSMQRAINGAIWTAQSGIWTLRSMFYGTSFRFNEYIPMPHFYMSGSFNAKTKAVPTVHVNWYEKAVEYGAIFSTPQIIGVGDAAQPEILLGEDKLKKLVGGGPTVTNYITVNGAEDPEAWASKFAKRIKMEMRTA